MDIESVHFHEVGAVDAMVDIVCAAVGIEALGVDEIVCSPLERGRGNGEVCARHVSGARSRDGGIACRGARLFVGSAGRAGDADRGRDREDAGDAVRSVSGDEDREKRLRRGTRDFPGIPMLCGSRSARPRTQLAAKPARDTISVLEANLDDLNPQVFGYVMDRLLEEGALDVFGMPVQMKKNRPGTLLTVLCKPEDAGKLTQLIFAETTTLGVRRREEQRQTLARRWVRWRRTGATCA